MYLMKIINNVQINTQSGSLIISHPQQYNLSNQNLISHINQDPYASYCSIYQTNRLHSDPSYQKRLQNQFNTFTCNTKTFKYFNSTVLAKQLRFNRKCIKNNTIKPTTRYASSRHFGP